MPTSSGPYRVRLQFAPFNYYNRQDSAFTEKPSRVFRNFFSNYISVMKTPDLIVLPLPFARIHGLNTTEEIGKFVSAVLKYMSPDQQQFHWIGWIPQGLDFGRHEESLDSLPNEYGFFLSALPIHEKYIPQYV
jgi:hypothetical protein